MVKAHTKQCVTTFITAYNYVVELKSIDQRFHQSYFEEEFTIPIGYHHYLTPLN